MVAHDLAAHDLVELALQIAELARQRFKVGEGNHADLRVFERHGIAGMAIGADAVQPQQFAGHLKARDLVASVF